MIKTFSSILKINVKQKLQFRTSAISGVCTQLFFGFMQIFLYSSFLGQGIAEFSLSQMASYIWLQQAFYTMFHFFDNCKNDISKKIINGDIAYQLVRPINLYDYWFQTSMTKALGDFIMRGFILALIVVWLPSGLGLMMPSSALHFLLFVLSAMIGLLLITSVKMIGYVLTMYTLSSQGVFSFIVAVATLLAGGVVPLPMLPEKVQLIFSFFPFRYVSDLPFRIYIGNLDLIPALIQIGIQIAWLVGLIIIGKLVVKHKLKKIVVQGG